VKNNFIIILATLVGWILFKYLLLGNVTFEQSFKFGFMYHGTALMIYAILATYNGIKTLRPTPDFLEGFKHVGKTVVGYGIGATAVVGIWHHLIVKDATHARLVSVLDTISSTFSSEEAFIDGVAESGLSSDLSLSEWITSQHEAAEIFYAAKTQISLSLMVYLLVGLFISFVASLLWTKVWVTTQHSDEKAR